MKRSPPPLLIVTDLDGTLLDHFSYSLEEARSTLQLLQRLSIPVIFNTSKTAEETRALGENLGLSDPFIVENGSAIHYPKRRFSAAPVKTRSNGDCWVQTLGLARATVVRRMTPLEEAFRFTRAATLSLQQFTAITGLSMHAARRAGHRQYSELLIWEDTPESLLRFRSRLRQSGLNLLQGGRFLHVLGNTDKGHALKRVRAAYPEPIPVMALGDSANDAAMLHEADYAAWIRSPAHDLPGDAGADRALVSESEGPAGWAECVHRILRRLNIHHDTHEAPHHG